MLRSSGGRREISTKSAFLGALGRYLLSPHEVVYAYSNDATNWTRISGATATADMDAAAGAWVSLPYKEIPQAAHYLRFGITKAGAGPNSLTGGGNSTALGELELYGE